VGQVLRAEIEGYLDGLSVVAVMAPRAPRAEPERLELKASGSSDQPLVTSTLAPKRSGERGGRRGDRPRGRDGRDGRERSQGRERGQGRDRRGGRDRQDSRHERGSRPAPPPVDDKPKPKRLRPAKTHRSALLEAVPAEQRPIAEQLLAGGMPAVRQAIDKQNETLRSEGKTEVKPDALLRVAEDLRPKVLAATWRDRAEAAVAIIDELDLRDLRSVVNAAGDAGRDEESRALAAQLREGLTSRVEEEHAAWLTELSETVNAGRVVRALRLSSRPPKAGAMIPGDVATQLAEATAASLTDETGPDRWATVLDALAYSPLRRRVIPQSLPANLAPELRATIARLATRLPEIAHIFDIEPDPSAERAERGQARRRTGRKGGDDRKGGGRPGKRGDGGKARKGGSGDGGKTRTRGSGTESGDATPADADAVETTATPDEAAPEVTANGAGATNGASPENPTATSTHGSGDSSTDDAAPEAADAPATGDAPSTGTPDAPAADADQAATTEATDAEVPSEASATDTDDAKAGDRSG
jgi:hypothetical protein